MPETLRSPGRGAARCFHSQPWAMLLASLACSAAGSIVAARTAPYPACLIRMPCQFVAEAIPIAQAATASRQGVLEQESAAAFVARYVRTSRPGKLVGIYQNRSDGPSTPPTAGATAARQGTGVAATSKGDKHNRAHFVAPGAARATKLPRGVRAPRTLQPIAPAPRYTSADVWPGTIAAGLTAKLQAAGFTVCRLTGYELANSAILDGHVLPTLILLNPVTVPAGAAAAIRHYVHSRGFLVSLGGPAFSHPLFRVGSEWLGRAEILRQLEQVAVTEPLSLPRRAGQWKEITNDSKPPFTVRVLTDPRRLPPGLRRGYQFHFFLNGWCGFRSPPVQVPKGNRLTIFWAKGGKHAHQLAVEWDERDGARWIGTVQLHTHWTRYVLPESAFPAWPHPAIAGRYFAGDHLHLHHAATINFGLANTATDESNGRRYRITVAGVGTAAIPARFAAAASMAFQRTEVPTIDTIAPGPYKLFRVTDMKRLTVNPRQALAPALALPTPASTYGIYPRAQATGIGKDMTTRYVPLLNCLGKNGRFVATAAALVLPSTGASSGQAATLSVPVTDPAFFTSAATQQWLVGIIRRVHAGLYLAEGGTKQYACFAGTAMPVGAVVVDRGRASRTVRVISTITDSAGKTVYRHNFVGTVPAGGWRQLVTVWKTPTPAAWENVYRVTTTLESGRAARPPMRMVDRLVGPLRVLGTVRHPHFVTVRKGLFYLRGKPWYAYGANFWPETSIGQNNGFLFEHWLSRQSYDPQAVERNLHDVKALGFNTIFISFGAADDPWNLLDVLARARKLGLKVNLSLRSSLDGLAGGQAGPGTFRFRRVGRLISKLHLSSNDALFSYNVNWEPLWGSQAHRRRLDPQWRAWIIRHYGSIQKAQAAWHCSAPRWRGRVTNPSDAQVAAGRQGPAAAMVLVYNHFLNTLLERTYGTARRKIRSLDRHHLVSFRMSMAGDPGMPGDEFYDFAGLAQAVDMFEPEGYGIMSLSPRVVRRAVFTIQYARAINPNLPVIYAEFGQSEWNHFRHADSPTLANRVARIYALFYKAILRGGGNGAICWWFPGGYRYGERSDFGIINPDRSWRPVSYIIHDFAARMRAVRPLPTPAVRIPIDLDHVRAERGVYLSVRTKFWAYYEAGKLPGLKVRH